MLILADERRDDPVDLGRVARNSPSSLVSGVYHVASLTHPDPPAARVERFGEPARIRTLAKRLVASPSERL